MKLLFILLSLLVVGCSTVQPKIVQVKIPIPVFSRAPIIPDKPTLPIYSLNKESKPPEVMKAYVSSVHLLNDWGNACYQTSKAQ
jgi:hypothetical protein